MYVHIFMSTHTYTHICMYIYASCAWYACTAIVRFASCVCVDVINIHIYIIDIRKHMYIDTHIYTHIHVYKST